LEQTFYNSGLILFRININQNRRVTEMARTSIYLNFMGETEGAFNFYKEVFGTEFTSPVQRMRDIPPDPNQPPLSANEQNMIMHVELPILGGLVLMGTDMLASMGHEFELGNNISLNLEPDTRAETYQLYQALSEGGEAAMPLQEMFWGGYFGSCTDKFGVRWMFNCANQE
jgi:PhnB protein